MKSYMRLMTCLLLFLLTYAVSGCGDSRNAHFVEAVRFLKEGKTARAKQAMQTAIEGSTDRYKAVITASALYSFHNKDREAENLLIEMLEQPKRLIGRGLGKHEEIAILLEVSNLQYKQGRLPEGIETVERALRLMPDHHELQNSVAYFYAEADINLPKALELAEKAHLAAPDKGHITDTLGWVHYKMGNLKQAKYFMQLAVKQSPDSAEQRYHLGVVYRDVGERSRAWIELKKALAVDPKMTKARKVLRNLTIST